MYPDRFLVLPDTLGGNLFWQVLATFSRLAIDVAVTVALGMATFAFAQKSLTKIFLHFSFALHFNDSG